MAPRRVVVSAAKALARRSVASSAARPPAGRALDEGGEHGGREGVAGAGGVGHLDREAGHVALVLAEHVVTPSSPRVTSSSAAAASTASAPRRTSSAPGEEAQLVVGDLDHVGVAHRARIPRDAASALGHSGRRRFGSYETSRPAACASRIAWRVAEAAGSAIVEMLPTCNTSRGRDRLGVDLVGAVPHVGRGVAVEHEVALAVSESDTNASAVRASPSKRSCDTSTPSARSTSAR
jgi:hypothetical protein